VTIEAGTCGGAFVRRLEDGDADAFRTVRLRALREDSASFLASYEEEGRLSVDEFAGRLNPRDPDRGTFGAFREDRLVGIVGFYRHAHTKARHRASLWGMYVVAEERGNKLAGRC